MWIGVRTLCTAFSGLFTSSTDSCKRCDQTINRKIIYKSTNSHPISLSSLSLSLAFARLRSWAMLHLHDFSIEPVYNMPQWNHNISHLFELFFVGFFFVLIVKERKERKPGEQITKQYLSRVDHFLIIGRVSCFFSLFRNIFCHLFCPHTNFWLNSFILFTRLLLLFFLIWRSCVLIMRFKARVYYVYYIIVLQMFIF